MSCGKIVVVMILTLSAAPTLNFSPRFTDTCPGIVGVDIWFAICLENVLTCLNIQYLRIADSFTFLLRDHFSSRKTAAQYVTSLHFEVQTAAHPNK